MWCSGCLIGGCTYIQKRPLGERGRWVRRSLRRAAIAWRGDRFHAREPGTVKRGAVRSLAAGRVPPRLLVPACPQYLRGRPYLPSVLLQRARPAGIRTSRCNVHQFAACASCTFSHTESPLAVPYAACRQVCLFMQQVRPCMFCCNAVCESLSFLCRLAAVCAYSALFEPYCRTQHIQYVAYRVKALPNALM